MLQPTYGKTSPGSLEPVHAAFWGHRIVVALTESKPMEFIHVKRSLRMKLVSQSQGLEPFSALGFH